MTILVSVETTPNPNSMKLNLDGALGVSGAFTSENSASAPEVIQRLLQINGVQNIYTVGSFITLNRDPRMDWAPIITEAQQVFVQAVTESNITTQEQRRAAETEGQVTVLVQTFRDIPIQIKLTDGATEQRVGLPERFGNTARELQTHFGANYLQERYWANWGVRYGTLEEIAQEVASEIENLMDDATLEQKKQQVLSGESGKTIETSPIRTSDINLNHPDWQERFRLVQQLDASQESLPLLIQALQDEKPQIRRWAAAKLAQSKTKESVEALSHSLLNDTNVGVRRTAGDSLSDIADVSAEEAVCHALKDANKLVRWRAARFLAEVGTAAALPWLEKAKTDPEYEVRLEVEAAIHHIQEGSNAALPVWKQMSEGSV